jgi:c-di-AMP phosphodiesterase-like protein
MNEEIVYYLCPFCSYKEIFERYVKDHIEENHTYKSRVYTYKDIFEFIDEETFNRYKELAGREYSSYNPSDYEYIYIWDGPGYYYWKFTYHPHKKIFMKVSDEFIKEISDRIDRLSASIKTLEGLCL